MCVLPLLRHVLRAAALSVERRCRFSADDQSFAHYLIIEILAHAQKGLLRL
jgi:hypothetical protein